MKILLLSDNNRVFEDNSSDQAKILEYASLTEMFFVVAPASFSENPVAPKEIKKNLWMYKTNSQYRFLYVWDIFKLVSFEIKNQGFLLADVVVVEGGFTPLLSGYLISKKFKRPLYVFLSEKFERILLAPFGFKNFLLSKIIGVLLLNTDYIKVDNYLTKEKLRKKFRLKNSTIQMIKPFFALDAAAMRSELQPKQNTTEPSFIQKKFPEFKFTAVCFVDSKEQLKLALSMLKKLNKHFPPVYLLLIVSYNLRISKAKRLVDSYLKSFVRIDIINDNLNEYLASGNIFFAISEGEKYEEILSKACALGTTTIALESPVSRSLIEDGTTGFVCSQSLKTEIIDYFVAKTLFIMENPSSAVSFKLNMALSFKSHVNNTKKEYLDKLKLSWRDCLESYKKSHEKFYKF